MVELLHNTNVPQALQSFVTNNPNAGPIDFDSRNFNALKPQIKSSLNNDQGGLCAYCETKLAPSEGQIDHIKPKRGNNGYPNLTFVYTNYAHSCINSRTCGQKKKDGLLPIEPAPNCNQAFSLAMDGQLEPLPTLSRQCKHRVRQTRDMLGLQNAALVNARKQWVSAVVQVMKSNPSQVPAFLADKPFRHILRRLQA